jgi:hypothetical protein
MTLIFTPSSLTKFGRNGAYSYSQDIPLTGDLATVSTTLLIWLSSQLEAGESVSQIVLESGGSVTMDDVNAAVSVTASEGERTFSLTSESLPADLRDSLLSTWATLA